MEIKIFGKSLFKMNSGKAEIYLDQALNQRKESKYLPDFYRDMNGSSFELSMYAEELTSPTILVGGKDSKKKPQPQKEQKKLTPKGVYEAKMLNDKAFKLNTDSKYVDGQLQDFKDKLALIKSEEFDMSRGVNEIASIVARFENRKKYPSVRKQFEDYPYTTNTKISELLKAHSYLKIGQVAQFLADMPKEAVEVMKSYNKATDTLCKKQAVFYIIADKKDFQKSDKRRDPILLAQSPFGHFWQILGAWDKEMLLLEEL